MIREFYIAKAKSGSAPVAGCEACETSSANDLEVLNGRKEPRLVGL